MKQLGLPAMVLIVFAGFVCATRVKCGDVAPAPWRTGLRFRDFNSVVYLPGPEFVETFGVGWTRKDFGWAEIEPRKGEWHWEKTDRLVEEVHKRDLEILPILCYSAPWAAAKPGEGGSPPKHVADWVSYVEHVVMRYCAPPFNLRYFQVWNEPTREAGFWKGRTNLDFIDMIYLPAATVIRKHGGQVVFGGWPSSNSIDELDQLLTYRDAWAWTDIIDIHYNENSSWERLFDKWVRTGKCRGFWQTEIGFHSFPNYLPNCYLRAMHWALRHGWSTPNQYKLFWFAAWGNGKNGPKCLTQPGKGGKNVPTEHGRRLAVLNQVFGGGDLSLFSDFATVPEFPPLLKEQASTVLGFRVGEKRRVIVVFLDETACRDHPVMTVTVPRTDSGAVSVRLLTNTGEEVPVDTRTAGRGIRIGIDMEKLPLGVARGWGGQWKVATGYLVIDRNQ